MRGCVVSFHLPGVCGDESHLIYGRAQELFLVVKTQQLVDLRKNENQSMKRVTKESVCSLKFFSAENVVTAPPRKWRSSQCEMVHCLSGVRYHSV